LTGASAPRSHLIDDGVGPRLRVLSFGDRGHDLFVLPGISSPAAVWDFVAEPLAAARTVHVLDLRGRGESERAADDGYCLTDYAADAARAIEALQLVRPTLVGHSLGGRIAGVLALERPDLSGPLVIVDPPLSGPGRPPYPYPLAFYVDGIRAARDGLDLDRLRSEHPTWSERQIRGRATWLGTCDPRAVAESYRNLHVEDFLPIWERLPAPTLITGSHSAVVPSEAVTELLHRNPDARSIVVEGAGHMIPWDQPDRFLDAMHRALGIEER